MKSATPKQSTTLPDELFNILDYLVAETVKSCPPNSEAKTDGERVRKALREATQQIQFYVDQAVAKARIDEARNAYNLVNKQIQLRRDDPNLMWHELTTTLADRITTLNSNKGASDGV